MGSHDGGASSSSGLTISHDALTQEAQEMFGQFGGSRRPSDAEIRGMAERIAQTRGMNSEQQQEIELMLMGIADRLFPAPAPSVDPSAVPSSAPDYSEPVSAYGAPGVPGAHRPSPAQIRQMAEAVCDRTGEDRIEPARGVVQLMSDILFAGPDSGDVESAEAMGLSRPSPRTLEDVTERVVSSCGGAVRRVAVREMLTILVQALFGPGRDDGEGSQLATARSSVRSQSSMVSESREETGHMVESLITELSGELLAPGAQ
jgi:hypothetical protein